MHKHTHAKNLSVRKKNPSKLLLYLVGFSTGLYDVNAPGSNNVNNVISFIGTISQIFKRLCVFVEVDRTEAATKPLL